MSTLKDQRVGYIIVLKLKKVGPLLAVLMYQFIVRTKTYRYIYRSKYPKLAKLYYECVEKYRKDKERHALEEAQSFFKNMI